MTEDKGCKNCDALGIDSEIGVYYCCLSHRQDDLPKEFICDDYTPNKQLKRLEQENKELKAYKDVNEDFKKAWDELNKKYTEVLKLAKENADSNEYCLQELEQENKELKQALDKEPLAQKALVTGYSNYKKRVNELYKVLDSYRSALEEIRKILNKECGVISNAKAVGIINEVLNE